ncbi:MAG: aromatic ring-hydroxylating dioxygenase subunit alpha [Rhodospirillales bacterium]|nr:aromatic ring-hydroxylating dioxygenase subunit alpha [Rhodospirillales bacterium]
MPRRGLPAWTYQDSELLALEYERVILPSWQFACHVNQLGEPGAYATLELMRDPILVIRDRDGALRAFHNVCRHRGTRLLDGAGTCRARIACPYHGWTYGLDGRLLGVPAERTFPALDKSALSLKPVELEVLEGLVFIRVIGGGPSLREIWGDYSALLRPYRVTEMIPAGPISSERWRGNWKVIVDNNLENYHIPVGHPGYHRLLDNQMGGFMNAHGIAGSRSVLKQKPSENWVERMYQKLAPEALRGAVDEETARSWLFFSMPPNTGINLYPDSMDVFQMLPLEPATSLVRYSVLARPGESRPMRLLRYLNQRINRQVSAEDRWLSERVQSTIASQGYEPGPLSSYEGALVDFHDRIRAACPVATSDQPPAPGTMRTRNDDLLRRHG